MKDRRGIVSSRVIAAHEILPLLQQVPLFARVAESELECLDQAILVSAPTETTLVAQNDSPCSFWILLAGELRVTRVERDGGTNMLFHIEAGDTFGEAPLMVGTPIEPAQIETVSDSTLLRVSADAFWQLMASCRALRSAAVANMARRLEIYQTLTLHRQNLISLGTLSAGLMHELNNPGAAALRASSQLRNNLTRLQQISLRLTREQFTTEQTDCLVDLQEQALSAQSRVSIEPLEQADAEGSLMKWLDEMGVEEAWQIAPTLVGVGWSRSNLEGARQVLAPNLFSDTLHWLEALLSSFQGLRRIDENVGRITDLVMAVKKYSRDEEAGEHTVDVNDSLRSALMIVSHKLRDKQLTIDKAFMGDLPAIRTNGSGLIQAWVNLLENAIDASPRGDTIKLRTWMEGRQICVGIADHGPGITPEKRPHVFKPFFTSKPPWSGPGMGLHITHRIIVERCSGQIAFVSERESTEFVVRLPVGNSA